jgi:hypothetical protein
MIARAGVLKTTLCLSKLAARIPELRDPFLQNR